MEDLWDIVGYVFHADIYCGPCACERVAEDIDATGHIVPGPSVWETAEQYLDRTAGFLGVRDRYDEYTFDTDNFPKVLFREALGVLEEEEHCCRCGEEL